MTKPVTITLNVYVNDDEEDPQEIVRRELGTTLDINAFVLGWEFS